MSFLWCGVALKPGHRYTKKRVIASTSCMKEENMHIIRINTRTGTAVSEPMGEYAGLGGRALTSRVVRREVPPTCHPLGPKNKLVVATGVLSGTPAANSGRISAGAKSPLTGTIKESNAGGTFSQKLARLGIQALIFEDQPEAGAEPVVVHINSEGVTFRSAAPHNGQGTYATAEKLLTETPKGGVMVIGPAGEHKNLAASIQFTDPQGRPARAAGRGGLGAVMGSKGIKAVVLDDSDAEGVPIADKEAFRTANRRWVEIIKSHPVTSQGLPEYGTAILVNIINEAGALPTKNFRTGRFEWAADISGELLAETVKRRGGKVRHGCHSGCMIKCSQVFMDKQGDYLTSGLEYETIWAMGANTLINDLDIIAGLDRACDDIGLDTIETGNTIAVAMDAGVIEWGDGKAALGLLEKVRSGDPLGRIIGNGAAFTGKAYGVTRIPTVKGQSMPAYDPRAVKGVGVTYATSPMGADHTAGYAVATNILKVGGDVDPLSKAGQVELSKNLQVATAAVDAAGLCLFVAFAVLDTDDAVKTIADMVAAKTGAPFTPEDVVALGQAVLADEHGFNRDAGFTPADDVLPEFFSDPLEPHNVAWDFSVDELQAAKM